MSRGDTGTPEGDLPMRSTSAVHTVRGRTRMVRVVTVLAMAVSTLALGTAGLTSPAAAAGGGTVDLSGAVLAPWAVNPGVQLATVTGAGSDAPLTLVDSANERLLTLLADDAGQANFAYIPDDYLVYETGGENTIPTAAGRTLKPGTYRIVDESVEPIQASAPFEVLALDDHPPTSLYEGQSISGGFQYVEMRDGVELSVMVRFPNPDLYGPGPYPTVVEYSGYSPSNPDGPEPGTRIADLFGFATVGVNMRGSGCSGGVFDVFSRAQFADGYDVIETIARQPWVLHNKVGMVGLSYSGITQLYVASTAPPSLAAITPLSVIEDPWYEQWPGGIYNSGFTQQWLAQRDAQNAPGGTSWVTKRIEGGDTVCEANQSLRTQNPDFEAFGKVLEFRPADADERKLSDLVHNIDVPVYLTGGWQDEQTGSRFGIMLDDFEHAPVTKFTVFNGRHPDGYTPLVLSRWYEFLQMYVGRQVPEVPAIIRLGAPVVFEQEFHAPGLGMEPDRFLPQFAGDYEGARAAYEAEPPVRVLFESGGGDPAVLGSPKFRYEKSFDSWPPSGTTTARLYLGPDGTLTTSKDPWDSIDRFAYDPEAGPLSYTGEDAGDFLFPHIEADWQPFDEGKGLSYVTPPFADDKVIAGFGYLDLWLRSTATDADLEVVISELTPDGNETWVQNGLLRAGDRTIDTARSSGTFIEHFYDAAHYQPLPDGEFVNLQIPLFPVAHAIRAGSRLRVMVDTAGRDMPLWQFVTRPYSDEPVFHDIGRGGSRGSSLVLPILEPEDIELDIPDTYPACNALRGQVCRVYSPRANTLVSTTPPPTAGPTYHPLDPTRILDTRPGPDQVGLTAPLGPADAEVLQVAGTGGVPAGATAVLLNVTAVHPTEESFLSLTDDALDPGEVPPTSNLNLVPGTVRPNLVLARLDAQGRTSLYNNSGTVDVLADVVGWFDDGTVTGDRLTAVDPARILDTRPGPDQTGLTAPLGPTDAKVLDVAGRGGVPEDATAVVLNVTSVNPSAESFLTLTPDTLDPGEVPPTSSLNLAAGEVRPNLVVTKLDGNGNVTLYNNSGTVDVLADVVGYYVAQPGSPVETATPFRVLDTRPGPDQTGLSGPFGATDARVLQVSGVGAVPDDATAVWLNVTAVNATAESFLSLTPDALAVGEVPSTSNLNLRPGVVVPNLVLVKLDDQGRVTIYNNSGTVDVLADVVGWVPPPNDP